METSFNTQDYQKLLELKNSNEISLLDENFIKLEKYEVSIQNQISYNRKMDYCLLISKFLNRNIEIHEFRSKIKDLNEQDYRKSRVVLQNLHDLQYFSLASDLENFGYLLSSH